MKRTIIAPLLTLVALAGQAQEPFFRTDSAVVRGRIVDYSTDKDFQSISALVPDVFTGENSNVTAEIRQDGTFEKHLLLHYPLFSWFYTRIETEGYQQIPFYLCPGDTLDITIRFNDGVIPECEYSGGNADEVARLLKVRYDVIPLYDSCRNFEGDIDAYNRFTDSLYTVQVHEASRQADSLHFTPFERRLALCDLASNWGTAYLIYFDQIKTKLEQEDPRAPYKADNAVMECISKPELYPLLKRLPNADSLMLATRFFHRYLRNVEYSAPMMYPLYAKRGTSWESNRQNVVEQLSLNHNVGQRLFESKEDMLPIQLMQLHVLNDAVEQWMCEGTIEEDFSAVKPFLKHPAVSMMAQQFYEEMLAYEPTLPLPEGAAADFIKNILKQYPNRYIILDFWALYCSPCKMEIQDTRNFRQRLHEREDVKFVFLANERNPKNRAYLDFVNENLKDEANIVIDDTRLRQLQDLFGFAGLPYNVTLTPDGRIVRDGILLHQFELGYDSFIQRLEEMKEEVGFIDK